VDMLRTTRKCGLRRSRFEPDPFLASVRKATQFGKFAAGRQPVGESLQPTLAGVITARRDRGHLRFVHSREKSEAAQPRRPLTDGSGAGVPANRN
jgi:hypothetical protein